MTMDFPVRLNMAQEAALLSIWKGLPDLRCYLSQAVDDSPPVEPELLGFAYLGAHQTNQSTDGAGRVFIPECWPWAMSLCDCGKRPRRERMWIVPANPRSRSFTATSTLLRPDPSNKTLLRWSALS